MLVNPESGLSCVEREKKLKGDPGLPGLLAKLDCPGIQSGSCEIAPGLLLFSTSSARAVGMWPYSMDPRDDVELLLLPRSRRASERSDAFTMLAPETDASPCMEP